MPRIPTYQTQDVPLGRVAPGTGSIVVPRAPAAIQASAESFDTGFGEAGKVMARNAMILADTADQMRKARAVRDLGTNQVRMLKTLSDFEVGLEGRQDYENFQPEYNQVVDSIQKDWEANIGDQDVLQALQVDLAKESLTRGVKIRHAARKREIDQGKSQILQNELGYESLLNTTRGEEERQDVINRHKLDVVRAVKAGWIDYEDGIKRIGAFRGKADTVQAMRDLRDSPDTFDPDRYPFVPAREKISMGDQALRLVEQREARNDRSEAKAEREAESRQKKILENNDFALTRKSIAGQLTVPELEAMAERRLITAGTYRALHRDMETADAKNNPLVLGDLVEKLEFQQDIRVRLTEARENGDINATTYETLKAKNADTQYKRGLNYLSNALKPTQFDQWSVDKHLRHAEAVEEFNTRVSGGEDALQVSKDLTNAYLGDIARSDSSLRNPRFLVGDKKNQADLATAERTTYEAWLSNRLDDATYGTEMKLIRQLRDRAEKNAQTSALTDQQKKEAEQRAKDVRKGER